MPARAVVSVPASGQEGAKGVSLRLTAAYLWPLALSEELPELVVVRHVAHGFAGQCEPPHCGAGQVLDHRHDEDIGGEREDGGHCEALPQTPLGSVQIPVLYGM